MRSAATPGAAVRKSNSAAVSALFTATFSAPVAIIRDSRVNRAAGSLVAASTSRLRHQLLQHAGGDGEIQRFLGREVPVHGAGANARAAGYLIERDGETLRGKQLLRGPQHLLAIAARVSPQLPVTPVSGLRLRRSGLMRAGHVGDVGASTGFPPSASPEDLLS